MGVDTSLMVRMCLKLTKADKKVEPKFATCHQRDDTPEEVPCQTVS